MRRMDGEAVIRRSGRPNARPWMTTILDRVESFPKVFHRLRASFKETEEKMDSPKIRAEKIEKTQKQNFHGTVPGLSEDRPGNVPELC